MEGRACENGTQSPDKTAKVSKKKNAGEKEGYMLLSFFTFSIHSQFSHRP